MSKDKNVVRTLPQPGTRNASEELALKSVGKGKFVGTYHRNAYGLPQRKDA
jgi:hypothetical protein